MQWLGTIPLHSFGKMKTSSTDKSQEEQTEQVITEAPETADTKTSSCKNV